VKVLMLVDHVIDSVPELVIENVLVRVVVANVVVEAVVAEAVVAEAVVVEAVVVEHAQGQRQTTAALVQSSTRPEMHAADSVLQPSSREWQPGLGLGLGFGLGFGLGCNNRPLTLGVGLGDIASNNRPPALGLGLGDIASNNRPPALGLGLGDVASNNRPPPALGLGDIAPCERRSASFFAIQGATEKPSRSLAVWERLPGTVAASAGSKNKAARTASSMPEWTN
jgi:hypothetical protein